MANAFNDIVTVEKDKVEVNFGIDPDHTHADIINGLFLFKIGNGVKTVVPLRHSNKNEIARVIATGDIILNEGLNTYCIPEVLKRGKTNEGDLVQESNEAKDDLDKKLSELKRFMV